MGVWSISVRLEIFGDVIRFGESHTQCDQRALHFSQSLNIHSHIHILTHFAFTHPLTCIYTLTERGRGHFRPELMRSKNVC